MWPGISMPTARDRASSRGEKPIICDVLASLPIRRRGRRGPAKRRALRLCPAAELARMRVTPQDVSERFQSVHDRAQPGIYPGVGPRRLFEIEMDALRSHPDCGVLWAAASGSNQSVGRDAFLACGGFDEELSINEHRELALRLCQSGLRMVPVDGAFSYHLTHRTGWRDPVGDSTWERTILSGPSDRRGSADVDPVGKPFGPRAVSCAPRGSCRFQPWRLPQSAAAPRMGSNPFDRRI